MQITVPKRKLKGKERGRSKLSQRQAGGVVFGSEGTGNIGGGRCALVKDSVYCMTKYNHKQNRMPVLKVSKGGEGRIWRALVVRMLRW